MTILRRGRTYWWCPEGCGKSVMIDYNKSNLYDSRWFCFRCKNYFTKKELALINPKIMTKKNKMLYI
jgi:hypothetical protein